MSVDAATSTSEFDERIERVVAQVPDWNDGGTTWKWLTGGGAHKNFLLTKSDGQTQAVIKLWNCEWEGLGIVPPSAVPILNTLDAGRIGIGAPVISIISDPLALMIEFLPSKAVNLKDPGIIPKVASKARELHDSGLNFRRDFNPFAESRVIMASAHRSGVTMPDQFAEIVRELQRVEQALDLRLKDFVPCHNDLYNPNLLEQPDGTIKLIDYDLSGNSDRCYDLGFLSTFERLDPDEVGRLVEAYFGQYDEKMHARVEMFSIAADYCSFSLFATASAVSDVNDDYDYAGHLERNWANICRRLNEPSFGKYLSKL